MSEIVYEFSGTKVGMRQPDDFLASSTNSFAFDISFEELRPAVHISNKKIFAGSFPLLRSRSVGYACTRVHRSWEHIRHSPHDTYVLRIPVRGAVSLYQFGQRIDVGEGEIGLTYVNAPFRVETRPNLNCEYLVLQAYVPTHMMRDLVPDPERICSSRIPTLAGPGRLAKQAFLTLFEEAEHFSQELSMTCFSTGLEAFAEAARARSGLGVHVTNGQNKKLRQVLDYIELHSSDAGLTVEKVAHACQISQRYIHYLLKNDNKSFHELLWQGRLSRAHSRIVDRLYRSQSIGKIATSLGFKSNAHFSRVFRKRFGCSPREARQGKKPLVDAAKGL